MGADSSSMPQTIDQSVKNEANHGASATSNTANPSTKSQQESESETNTSSSNSNHNENRSDTASQTASSFQKEEPEKPLSAPSPEDKKEKSEEKVPEKHWFRKWLINLGIWSLGIWSIPSFLVAVAGGVQLISNSTKLVKRVEDAAQSESWGIAILVFCIIEFILIVILLIYRNFLISPKMAEKRQLETLALKHVSHGDVEPKQKSNADGTNSTVKESPQANSQ